MFGFISSVVLQVLLGYGPPNFYLYSLLMICLRIGFSAAIPVTFLKLKSYFGDIP